ncbi:MAG: tRNA pseudouridine(55) synthase TruB [Pseudomonadota bacterium]
MAGKWRSVNGVLLFDKPLGISSNLALQKVRRLFQAEKAGHTGTLDPLASGLLPVCFGEATKFSTGLLDADKTYLATICLGKTTTTGDREGEVVVERPVDVDEEKLRAVIRQFTGEVEQLPPMHSAIKFQGKPLYEYIRKGETVDRASRQVLIHDLQVERFSGNELVVMVHCSKGTYVRTLAEDIGEALGCGAHLSDLRRTAIAHCSLEQAYTWEDLEAMSPGVRDACLLPVDVLLPAYPVYELDDMQAKRLGQGQRLGLGAAVTQGPVRLYFCGEFVGLGEIGPGGRLAPVRMLSAFARNAANTINDRSE